MTRFYHITFFKCVIFLLLINGGVHTGEASTINIDLVQISKEFDFSGYQSTKYSCGTKQALPCVEKLTGIYYLHKLKPNHNLNIFNLEFLIL